MNDQAAAGVIKSAAAFVHLKGNGRSVYDQKTDQRTCAAVDL